MLTSGRYGPKGERLVAGIVPLSADRTQVLLIQSSSRKGWVLPKGGWEADESEVEAATREAWEEAGIHVTIERDLGVIEEQRSESQIKKYGETAPRAMKPVIWSSLITTMSCARPEATSAGSCCQVVPQGWA